MLSYFEWSSCQTGFTLQPSVAAADCFARVDTVLILHKTAHTIRIVSLRRLFWIKRRRLCCNAATYRFRDIRSVRWPKCWILGIPSRVPPSRESMSWTYVPLCKISRWSVAPSPRSVHCPYLQQT